MRMRSLQLIEAFGPSIEDGLNVVNLGSLLGGECSPLFKILGIRESIPLVREGGLDYPHGIFVNRKTPVLLTVDQFVGAFKQNNVLFGAEIFKHHNKISAWRSY